MVGGQSSSTNGPTKMQFSKLDFINGIQNMRDLETFPWEVEQCLKAIHIKEVNDLPAQEGIVQFMPSSTGET